MAPNNVQEVIISSSREHSECIPLLGPHTFLAVHSIGISKAPWMCEFLCGWTGGRAARGHCGVPWLVLSSFVLTLSHIGHFIMPHPHNPSPRQDTDDLSLAPLFGIGMAIPIAKRKLPSVWLDLLTCLQFITPSDLLIDLSPLDPRPLFADCHSIERTAVEWKGFPPPLQLLHSLAIVVSRKTS